MTLVKNGSRLNKTETLIERIERRIFKIFLPFYITFIYLIVIFFVLGDKFYTMLFFMGVYLVPPWGKESAVPGAIFAGVPWVIAAISIAFMDFVSGLFMMWNFDLALKLPILGKWIEKTEKRGKEYLRNHSAANKAAFIFIVLFVMFPIQGSGGIGGTIVGRIIGMDKYRVLAAITTGAFLGTFTIALFADQIKTIVTKNLQLTLTSIVIIMLTVFLIHLWRRRQE